MFDMDMAMQHQQQQKLFEYLAASSSYLNMLNPSTNPRPFGLDSTANTASNRSESDPSVALKLAYLMKSVANNSNENISSPSTTIANELSTPNPFWFNPMSSNIFTANLALQNLLSGSISNNLTAAVSQRKESNKAVNQ